MEKLILVFLVGVLLGMAIYAYAFNTIPVGIFRWGLAQLTSPIMETY